MNESNGNPSSSNKPEHVNVETQANTPTPDHDAAIYKKNTEALASREFQDYDTGFSEQVDPAIKEAISKLVSAAHDSKLQEITTVGGCIRLILEDLKQSETYLQSIKPALKRLSPEKANLHGERIKIIEERRKKLLDLMAQLHIQVNNSEPPIEQ